MSPLQTWIACPKTTMEGRCLSCKEHPGHHMQGLLTATGTSSPCPNFVRRWGSCLRRGLGTLLEALGQEIGAVIKIPYYWFWPIGQWNLRERCRLVVDYAEFNSKAGRSGLIADYLFSPKNHSDPHLANWGRSTPLHGFPRAKQLAYKSGMIKIQRNFANGLKTVLGDKFDLKGIPWYCALGGGSICHCDLLEKVDEAVCVEKEEGAVNSLQWGNPNTYRNPVGEVFR